MKPRAGSLRKTNKQQQQKPSTLDDRDEGRQKRSLPCWNLLRLEDRAGNCKFNWGTRTERFWNSTGRRQPNEQVFRGNN